MLQETGTKRQNHICRREHGTIGVARSLVSRSSGCLKEAEAREVHGGQILLKGWILCEGNRKTVKSFKQCYFVYTVAAA